MIDNEARVFVAVVCMFTSFKSVYKPKQAAALPNSLAAQRAGVLPPQPSLHTRRVEDLHAVRQGMSMDLLSEDELASRIGGLEDAKTRSF